MCVCVFILYVFAEQRNKWLTAKHTTTKHTRSDRMRKRKEEKRKEKRPTNKPIEPWEAGKTVFVLVLAGVVAIIIVVVFA